MLLRAVALHDTGISRSRMGRLEGVLLVVLVDDEMSRLLDFALALFRFLCLPYLCHHGCAPLLAALERQTHMVAAAGRSGEARALSRARRSIVVLCSSIAHCSSTGGARRARGGDAAQSSSPSQIPPRAVVDS